MLLSSAELDDAGTYQCMLGAIVSSDLVKDTGSIAVMVAREAQLDLEGGPEDPWVLLEGEEVALTCVGREGIPPPEIVGLLGSEELWEESREEAEDVRLTFTFTPERKDSGLEVKCSSQQRDQEGEVLFDGPQEITKQVTRKLHPQFVCFMRRICNC